MANVVAFNAHRRAFRDDLDSANRVVLTWDSLSRLFSAPFPLGRPRIGNGNRRGGRCGHHCSSELRQHRKDTLTQVMGGLGPYTKRYCVIAVTVGLANRAWLPRLVRSHLSLQPGGPSGHFASHSAR